MKDSEYNEKPKGLLQNYKDVFREYFTYGLPPIRSVGLEIEEKEGEKAHHRPLFQLYTSDLQAAKRYVESLLRKVNTRSNKSPYGSSLFFVKKKNAKLRIIVDYRTLNCIKKRNNARSNECCDLLGDARIFPKLDLKHDFIR